MYIVVSGILAIYLITVSRVPCVPVVCCDGWRGMHVALEPTVAVRSIGSKRPSHVSSFAAFGGADDLAILGKHLPP